LTILLGISSQWNVFISRDYQDDQTIAIIGGHLQTQSTYILFLKTQITNGLMSGM